MDIYTLLVITHIIGAVLGVGGATFAEIFLNKALKDGRIDPLESDLLRTIYTVIRVGLVVSILSGFGFLLLYKFNGEIAKLYNPLLWAKLTILFIILINAVLLQARKISLWWGSAFSFVSWYAALIISAMLHGPTYSYVDIMLYYFIAVVIGGIALDFVRKSMKIKI